MARWERGDERAHIELELEGDRILHVTFEEGPGWPIAEKITEKYKFEKTAPDWITWSYDLYHDNNLVSSSIYGLALCSETFFFDTAKLEKAIDGKSSTEIRRLILQEILRLEKENMENTYKRLFGKK